MANEIIGIASAIGLTSLLFGLRRLILPSERGNKRRYVPTPQHRETNELNTKALEDDDAWLLWMPDVEIETRAGHGQSGESGRKPLLLPRNDERTENRTIGGETR